MNFLSDKNGLGTRASLLQQGNHGAVVTHNACGLNQALGLAAARGEKGTERTQKMGRLFSVFGEMPVANVAMFGEWARRVWLGARQALKIVGFSRQY